MLCAHAQPFPASGCLHRRVRSDLAAQPLSDAKVDASSALSLNNPRPVSLKQAPQAHREPSSEDAGGTQQSTASEQSARSEGSQSTRFAGASEADPDEARSSSSRSGTASGATTTAAGAETPAGAETAVAGTEMAAGAETAAGASSDRAGSRRRQFWGFVFPAQSAVGRRKLPRVHTQNPPSH